MLRGLRKASSNWLGKVVMAAVVGFWSSDFAIWGIGDIFRGFGRSTVAKIGRTEITVEQFRSIYNDRLQQYSRQAGRPIGLEQARQMGLDRALIGQIVSEILLDERARELGLSLSDAEVAKQITTDPAFRDRTGSSTVSGSSRSSATPALPKPGSWPNSAAACCGANSPAPSRRD